jgi:hypothetical protein
MELALTSAMGRMQSSSAILNERQDQCLGNPKADSPLSARSSRQPGPYMAPVVMADWGGKRTFAYRILCVHGSTLNGGGDHMPVWAEAAFYLGVLGLLAGIYSKLSQAVDRLTK